MFHQTEHLPHAAPINPNIWNKCRARESQPGRRFAPSLSPLAVGFFRPL